jgi:DNA-binding LacI/PurR family transcriptional regulator
MARKPLAYTTKTQALSAHLIKMARQLGPDARLPTMAQLAEETGTSVMTLNRALSELEAQGWVIRRQGSGTYVTERAGQNAVGLVYDREGFGIGESPFRSLLLHEAQRRAEDAGERFSLFLADPSQNVPVHPDLAEALKTRRVSGLLYAANSRSKALGWLLKQNLPIVALAYAPLAPYRVRFNHAQTAELGTRELIRQGCKRIALWMPVGVGLGPSEADGTFEELDAYQAALAEGKLKFDAKLVYRLDEFNHEPAEAGERVRNREQGQSAARAVFELQDKANWPDGVVCLDDDMTRGALATWLHLGVRVGKEKDATLKVASHTNKNSDLLWGFENTVTLLEFDPAEVAGAMFSMLETLLRDEEPASPVVSIAPRLVS